HSLPESTAGVYSANNIFYSQASSSNWFNPGGSLAGWRPLVHDTTSIAQDYAFPDASRTIATYMASLGYGSADQNAVGFLNQARQQSKANWRQQFTAAAVNAYIRAGYGVQ